jgi:acetyl esterase/lipase
MEYNIETFIYKTVPGLDIKADVIRTEKPRRVARTLVYIHGGALIMGTRSGVPKTQLDRYLDAGFNVVSIDYRLAPETKLPEIIEDIKDAFIWVRDKGPELFGANPAKLAVAGSSAGGYLTLMTGFAVEPKPKALISFYGYGDVVGDWYAKPDPFYSKKPAVSREAALMSVGTTPLVEGGDGREPFYLYCRQQGLWPREVSGWDPWKEPEKFKPYCPIQNITREYTPTILLHGDRDTDVPYEQSATMAGALSRAGVDNSLVTIEGGGHGFEHEESDDTKRSMDLVMSFMKEHVK